MINVLIVCQNEEKTNTICEASLKMSRDIKVTTITDDTTLRDYFEATEPDIAFISVENININGIELATHIKEKEYKTHIIFLSDYDNFEFLRKSLQIGVEDYFLEKIIEEDVIEKYDKLLAKIDIERKNDEIEKRKDSMYENIAKTSGYSFVYSVLFNGEISEDILYLKDILKLGDKGFWINLKVDSKTNNISLQKIDFYSCINNTLKGNATYVIGPRMHNRIAIYISLKEEKNDEDNIKYAKDIANKILCELENKFNLKLKIGISNVSDIENILYSYEETLECLCENDSRKICHFTDKKENILGMEYKKYQQIEKKLIESIDMGKDDAIDNFIMLLKTIDRWPIIEKKNKLIEVFVLICHSVNKLYTSEKYYVMFSKFYDEFMKLDAGSVDAWALNKFQYILKSYRKYGNDSLSDIIKTALYYMYEHYNENISLNDIAKVCGVSLQYLSKVFKDEIGKNYVEWLNQFRIDKAKELMNDNQFTIKEVCFKVGYNDPNYFSRIFKKYEGIAPTDFLNKKD